ncbi:proton-conducting transporter transmembrane domain-containing protein [Solicola gregarius]|uniref:NADH:quinone oxidoreductase/Mrp antiporter transmembrane domain-containing protein n=1 Tax=Solicola gregarius TaxID=2908642 RepID=A0AA46THW7_9ACTN|nr:proton-conducting transporter membrane subunit [Solicola gregarius]UYM05664.1 hypothetical protein L0C25_00875 [Solicola gregarius]
MSVALWLLVLLPTISGALLALGGRRLERYAGGTGIVVAAGVLVLAVAVAYGRPSVSMPFVSGGPLALSVDGLASVVVVMVAAISLLVLAFASRDIGIARARFFGLMLIFVAAVEVTVTATTLSGLLLAWEIMGATSYGLIAHHWDGTDAVESGATAFLVTRTGDLGLYLAAGAALAAGSSLGFDDLAQLPGPWLHVVAAGVVAAALGKAAQLPFSFWLSRAMAGPSPVSALLHSAAMVAMGAYLLLRLHPLLAESGWAAATVAWVGALTALVLGAVAVAQADLKQLLAASTSSQLGFVVLAAGSIASGAVVAGTAQLVAHAATKALLFLVAGAWLTALGARRLDQLRGIARRDRLVGALLTVGVVTLAGIPPLSLWATKEAVLAVAGAYSTPLYVVGLAAAVLSALYAGKVLAYVWQPTNLPQVRSASGLQAAALLPLAVAAAGLSIVAVPGVAERFADLVGGEAPPTHWWELALGAVLATGAAAIAVLRAEQLPSAGMLRRWLDLERAAHLLVVRPTLALARRLAAFDDRVLDRAVVASAQGAARLASALAAVDDLRVDRAVAAVAAGARRLGAWARMPQTGQLHQYYAQAAVGLFAALVLLLLVR